MGITGLIPFLDKASKRGNISQFSGGSVAIDTYCWLHRGAFSCADKIALGQPTDAYVRYCMKLVHMLLANRIKPILVFDGRHLPAKAETEVKRRESRESNRRRAAELMKMGKSHEGKNLLRRSVDISHEMALELIKECQNINVDCIVAPYEADAQLAYLNINGFADVVITEDSDLTLFGCKKIFFKMDINGNGLLVEQENLHLAMGIKKDYFDIDKFRHMCILSGCDYLSSLPGIGLSKALKFVKNSESDILKSLPRIGSYLNMKSLKVSKEYCEGFICALITFKHQLVYCPIKRKQVRLHDVPDDVTEQQLYHAGNEVDEKLAYQLALGNYHPLTLKKLHEFDPDSKIQIKKKTNGWHETSSTNHQSIWSSDFKLKLNNESTKKVDDGTTKWPNTTGKIMLLKTKSIENNINTMKRSFEKMNDELNDEDMLKFYGSKSIENQQNDEDKITKKVKTIDINVNEETTNLSTTPKHKKNVFSKNIETSPCLVRPKRKLLTKIAIEPTIIDESVHTPSKYFSNNQNDDEITSHDSTDDSNKNTKLLSVNVIIPETPDEGLPISQPDEYKENTDNLKSHQVTTNLLRTDSGVDLKDDSNDKINYLDVEKHDEDHEDDDKDLNCFDNAKCDDNEIIDDKVRAPSPDDNFEFESTSQQTNSLRSSFFKWSNTKNTNSSNIFNKNKQQLSSKKSISSQSRSRTTRRTPVASKITPVNSQQSLLNMFGFKKQTTMKQ
ncbi:hypothetical protein HCN44_008464 [Aphidius gifuensis]|uniref:Exonuclease 1 n=1 Tax=Aphidius gifuensis TaxID=684658 RepID=A0A834XML6_APHGI|nr:exonuclease 1 [Aphidius gifuensis]KAF7989790.1 hypothetical protein HCN44_008464 [Aphidius gifuensis]